MQKPASSRTQILYCGTAAIGNNRAARAAPAAGTATAAGKYGINTRGCRDVFFFEPPFLPVGPTSMPIEMICPGCSRKLKVDDQFAGRQARCPVCSAIYTVGRAVGDPAGGAAAAAPSGTADPDQQWRIRTPEGQIYGPVLRRELDSWVADGRITGDCQLSSDTSHWSRADAVYPVLLDEVPAAARPRAGGGPAPAPAFSGEAAAGDRSPGRYRYTAPHRGGLVLALGVISWVIGCPVFGICAWVMGSSDLREMRLGRMDPSGQGLTQAGQILGMVHALLCVLGVAIVMFIILIGIAVN